MARFVRLSRAEAIAYLTDNPNFRELRQNNARISAPEDMSTEVAKRYTRGLRLLEAQGRWAHDLGELRGHTASEHHRGRKAKPGMENWRPPERLQRMFWEEMRFSGLDRRGHRVRAEARFTVTAGESVAVRALKLAAKGGMSVQLVLSGPLPGEQKELFTKGGYDAQLLLMKAGYRPTRRGAWIHQKDKGPGLERWLIDYMARGVASPTRTAWPLISLYQIYAREEINDVDQVVIGHQRTYYLPAGQSLTARRLPRH